MMMPCHARAASNMQGAVSDVLSTVCCLFLGDTLSTALPICLSLPRSMSSMSRILPYGSRGDVKSDDSHVRACTCIYPCTCFSTYLSMYRYSWVVTLRHHAMPYTDCLSLPLLSSLRRDRVRAMWNLSYITLLYYSLGPTSFDVGLRRIVILNDSCWRRPPKVPRLQSFGDPAGRRALPESSCRRSRVEACLFVW